MRSVLVLGIVLSSALLLLGGVTDGGLAAALVGVTAWAGYVAWSRAGGPRGLPLTLASVAVWGAAGWTLLQLVPLPLGLLSFLSPRGADVWRHADALTGRTAWHPLSVDPPATIFAAATLLAVAVMYSASARYASYREARVRLIYAVIGAVMALNFVALTHKVGGVDRVYGFYVPRYPTSHGLLSALLNPNHASAVACIAPPLLLGVTVRSSLAVRLVAVVGIVVSGVVAVLSLSRMGMLVLGLELGVMTVYVISLQREDGARWLRGGLTVLGALGTIGAVLVVAHDPVLAEARNTDVSKLRIPLQALSLAKDYWAVGVGRGAFGSAFPAYEGSLPTNARYLYVENWCVQLLCDMGFLAASAYVAALATSVFLTRGRATARPPYVGALVALGGLVLHDLVDFSMEFVGVSLLAAVLLAVVSTAGLQRSSRSSGPQRLRLAAAAGVAAVIGLGALGSSWHHRADDEQRALTARAQAGEPPAAIVTAAISAIERHPADPFFYGLVGALRLHDPAAGAFLVRAIELGPNRATTHFVFAKWLARQQRLPQAFAELRAAQRLEPHMFAELAAEMVRLGAGLPELMAFVDGLPSGDAVAGLLMRAKRFDDARELDEYLIATYPPAISARVREIERARPDLQRARTLAADLRNAAPTAPGAWIISASLADNDDDAEALLREGIRRAGKELALVEQLTRRRAVRLGLAAIPSELLEYQETLERAGQPAYRFMVFKAEVEIARHHPSAAIRYYLDAAAAAPESLEFLEIAAGLAEQTGQGNMAASLWNRLALMRPDNPRYREKSRANAAPNVSSLPGLPEPMPP